ncbi:hypothetical protein LX36DRAFT_391286 [Colletotrichum falcatum]|nr:hypothetical protein LX36DRAFT_391286 [Colletotrichum falcatum]
MAKKEARASEPHLFPDVRIDRHSVEDNVGRIPRGGCRRGPKRQPPKVQTWFGAYLGNITKPSIMTVLWQTLSKLISRRKTWMLLHRCNLGPPDAPPSQPPPHPLSSPFELPKPGLDLSCMYLTSGVLIDGLIWAAITADALVGSAQLFPRLSSNSSRTAMLPSLFFFLRSCRYTTSARTPMERTICRKKTATNR